MIGAVPGVEVGAWFEDRVALRAASVHLPTQAGICGRADEGAESVVLNGGYPDDWDGGDTILYTGAGGQNAAGRHTADQTLNRTNSALVTSLRLGLPVRVIRGSRLDSPNAPKSGYRYDGLYRVADHWAETGLGGFLIWRFRLERAVEMVYETLAQTPTVSDSPGLFDVCTDGEPVGAPLRVEATVSRIIRDTTVTREVKHLHGYRCQMCGERVETPSGPYAEAAHIQPLGRPHNGPDVLANVLCLCPTHHAAFDLYGVGIAGDESLIGLPGRLRTKKGHTIGAAFLGYRRGLFDAAQAEAAQAAARAA